ncbi:RING finger protein nhl-1-like [Branchiostoma lanceolatum]|uniref:RING finger protein nhl-1-like n=1 Tax=Branchiostoma lanceolatum TaxID=7740 RepID=UPI003455F79E
MAESGLSHLTRLYVKISNSLSEEDVRNLRVILGRESLGQAKVEQATALEMFNMLEADNKIGNGNLKFLVEVLRGLGKGRLAEEAEKLEQEHRREGTESKGPEEVGKSSVKKKFPVEACVSEITRGMENLGRNLTAAGGKQGEQPKKDIKESSLFIINVEGPAVESLPCSVTVTADTVDGTVIPQIEVTSPQGKTTLLVIHTTAHTIHVDSAGLPPRPHTSPPLAAGKGQTSRVRRVWGGEWRPWESGKHTLGVCMGGIKDLGSLTVDVGSNNPVLRFGQWGGQQGQFDLPSDVAVRGDRLYVADTWNQRVQVFDLSGKFCLSFSTTENPHSLAVQTDGTIVVKSGEEVMKYSPSGELLHKFPLGEYCSEPFGLAVQRDGRVVVADYKKHSIFLFEAAGTLVKQVGGKGQGEGQFYGPHFVCVDKDDNIIVADRANSRVQVFDKDLNFKHKFGQEGRQPQDMWGPFGVSADSKGNIVLANGGDNPFMYVHVGGVHVKHGRKLQVFRPDGTWVSTISSDGDRLHTPQGVAVTEDGHVFVADMMDHCVRKYRYM